MTPKSKVLVLGGTGAMGVYLVPELLRSGYKVVVTSRSERVSNERNLQYIKGDAKDVSFISEIIKNDKYDAIIDFMVYSSNEFESRIDDLLNSTKHYIFLSSYRVYADSVGRIKEDSSRLLDTVDDKKYLETDEYGLSKARQEDILKKRKKFSNWTILRPAISYSKDRFQLGTMEAHEFLPRALSGKPIIFPQEMLEKYTTMTWSGDVAKMISRIVLKKSAYKNDYIVSTSETHTWKEVLDIYKDILRVRIKIVPLREYVSVIGRPYQIKYDRMYNRKIDNSKILKETNIHQSDFMPLREGLRIELTNFSKRQKKNQKVDKKINKNIDKLTTTTLQKVRVKVSPRIRVQQVKRIAKSRIKFDGAIVTLTVFNNYGNVIQRYALQHFLKQNGFKFNMLDFHSGVVNKNHRHLRKFVNKYLIQEKFHPRLSKFYKIYIVGSDQVWRHFSINKGWGKFGSQFLSFVSSNKAHRVAYAASFGVDTFEDADIDEKRKNKIKPLVEKFNAISMREGSGKDLVEQLGGKDVSQVLDPTMLLNSSDYTKLVNNSKHADKMNSKVFFYLIEQTVLTESALEYYSEMEDTAPEGILPYAKDTVLPAMEQWLKGIRDANIVVTDSYHAVVFSIIFHTDFVVFDKKGGGIARIAELLKPLGLDDRIVIQGNKKTFTPRYKPVNWDSVDNILDKKRKESADWLLDALSKEKRKKV